MWTTYSDFSLDSVLSTDMMSAETCTVFVKKHDYFKDVFAKVKGLYVPTLSKSYSVKKVGTGVENDQLQQQEQWPRVTQIVSEQQQSIIWWWSQDKLEWTLSNESVCWPWDDARSQLMASPGWMWQSIRQTLIIQSTNYLITAVNTSMSSVM